MFTFITLLQPSEYIGTHTQHPLCCLLHEKCKRYSTFCYYEASGKASKQFWGCQTDFALARSMDTVVNAVMPKFDCKAFEF